MDDMSRIISAANHYRFASISTENIIAYHKSLNKGLMISVPKNDWWFCSDQELDLTNVVMPDPLPTDMSPANIIKDFIEDGMGCIAEGPGFILNISVGTRMKDNITISYEMENDDEVNMSRICLTMTQDDCKRFIRILGGDTDKMVISCDDFLSKLH